VGIERAAAFLQSASRDAGNVQHVYCSGGGSRIPGLAQVLANRLTPTRCSKCGYAKVSSTP
jgi:hypothetical protein